jgi:hypothetical protein
MIEDLISSIKNLIANPNNTYGDAFTDAVEAMLRSVPGLTVTPQPYGTQAFPDFHVYWAKGNSPKRLAIEAKSSKNTKRPKWNSGYPKEDAVYVFKGPKHVTTAFMFDATGWAEDMVEIERRKLLADALAYKGKRYGYRPRHSHEDYNDYISDTALRKNNEEEVFAYLRNLV